MNILQNSVHFHIDVAMSSQSLFNWKTLSFWKISYLLKIMFLFESILWKLIYNKFIINCNLQVILQYCTNLEYDEKDILNWIFKLS